MNKVYKNRIIAILFAIVATYIFQEFGDYEFVVAVVVSSLFISSLLTGLLWLIVRKKDRLLNVFLDLLLLSILLFLFLSLAVLPILINRGLLFYFLVSIAVYSYYLSTQIKEVKVKNPRIMFVWLGLMIIIFLSFYLQTIGETYVGGDSKFFLEDARYTPFVTGYPLPFTLTHDGATTRSVSYFLVKPFLINISIVTATILLSFYLLRDKLKKCLLSPLGLSLLSVFTTLTVLGLVVSIFFSVMFSENFAIYWDFPISNPYLSW